jgi:hypothetical protein
MRIDALDKQEMKRKRFYASAKDAKQAQSKDQFLADVDNQLLSV